MRSDRVAVLLLVVLVSACATDSGGGVGVAGPGADPSSTRHGQPATGSNARIRQVYDAVLRRYLTTNDPRSGDNAHQSTAVYVVDHAVVSAGDPMAVGGDGDAEAIPKVVQRAISRDLADVDRVRWVDQRDDVVVQTASCPHVRGLGVVITLAPVPREGDRVDVGVGGFAACLAGSWLTYVVQKDGNGWNVVGTTGPVSRS
jgi:hypothetical protein